MDNLTVRQRFILNNLIEKGPLSMKGLSQQIDVSERTILREISAINSFIKEYSLRISEFGGNIQLNGNADNIQRVKNLFEGIPLLWMLTQEQRQLLITAQLLLAKEPIKSAFFSYQFNVVEGTIIFYLDKIENFLKMKNLELVRKRGYGIEVLGSEWSKRNAFAELLYNYSSMGKLLSYLYEDESDYMIENFFNTVFNHELINKTKKIIKKINERGNILKDNDISYFSAFIHILLSIERTNSDMAIELPEYIIDNALSLKDGCLIRDIDEILKEEGIKLPKGELSYIAIHLYGDNNIYINDEYSKDGFEIEDLIHEIINIVNKKLNIDIKCDNQLMTGLKQHINPALYRLTLGLEIRNPVINEIREYYRELFEAVDYACRIVFSKYNISVPLNEVGYITMHVGAALERQKTLKSSLRILIICPNGIGTAKILCNKLKDKFPQIGEMDVCSLREMEERVKIGYDIVLSTVDINKKPISDITVISPFLPSSDVDKISSLIRGKLEENNVKHSVFSIYERSEAENEKDFSAADEMLKNFQLKYISKGSIEGVIAEISDFLYSSKFIKNKDKVESKIRKREEQGSVVVPDSHTALIHIRTDEIDSPFLGVFRLENFIEMRSIGVSTENVDTFLVMIARKNESDYILEILGKISIAMVEDKEFIKDLRFGDVKDIRKKLIEVINREEI
ncbi:transcriptional antiterminator, BglG family [Caloramator quimbayensis]|uniref:Transcriptional antiterminator, BglG family n=1 Tax=Caloramator quimbayensis TaxID=1147123 RepID=A0A1T4XY13_9CLOT|nr:BglG family transcription antiterminator [Caloramator quimbayensis]SKA94108.1 transcriptional antiterminator, BglG family [Caloramator quimbayensis]